MDSGLGQNFSAEEAAALGEGILACRDRLIGEGVNLAAYTSAENAADLNDLRLALSYDEWNLYGVSYGTRLALTAMRDYPEGIRSVILDSSVPLQVNLLASLMPNADRAFNVLFDGCTADPTCTAAYPELETTFFNVVQQLNNTPVVIPLTHPLTGETFIHRLSGDGFIGFLFGSLYSTGIIPLLPQIIFEARDGEFDTFAFIEAYSLIDSISLGMHYSVQCGEEFRFTTPEEIAAAGEVYPRLRGYFDSEGVFAICQSWGAKEADPIENQPVVSDIPTLVLAGEYDPITPPAWGQLAAENLSNSFYFEFTGLGHGVGTENECPLSISLAFLDFPTIEPDGSCIAGMDGPPFVTS